MKSECMISDLSSSSYSFISQGNTVLNSRQNNQENLCSKGNRQKSEVPHTSNAIKNLTENICKLDEFCLKSASPKLERFIFENPQEGCKILHKPLRLFNKNGKPLTDRMGRPLIDILGQPLVILDEKGLLKSDSKGNQVFNSLGESSIYSNTNLFIPPSDEEPGIPLLDIDKKHIIYMYDNKGHPLTDGLGRTLVNSSGSPMFGLKSCNKININNFNHYQLKNIYCKAPLENCVRRVQIFNSDLKPLTDEAGIILKGEKVICNKNGMPMCDKTGHSLFYKYGIPLFNSDGKGINIDVSQENGIIKKSLSLVSEGSLEQSMNEENSKLDLNNMQSSTAYFSTYGCEGKYCFSKQNNSVCVDCPSNSESKVHNRKHPYNHMTTLQEIDENVDELKSITELVHCSSANKNKIWQATEQRFQASYENCNGVENTVLVSNPTSNKEIIHQNKTSKEAIILFDASKKIILNHKSLMNAVLFSNNNGKNKNNFIRNKPQTNKIYSSNFIQYLKNVFNMTTMKHNANRILYNDYGKPLNDLYGNLIYDKYGLPLTGPRGIKLDEKTRKKIRFKLRNIPVLPITKKIEYKEILENKFINNGLPYYDKHGRPLYDLFGTPIYDVQGRPITDAFGRPLINATGQHLIDSEGNVLCSPTKTSEISTLTDLFGRRLYDKHARPLFDSYGRPRFDIFTNSMYDSCGRPATDGNGNMLYDFLNKPIQPHPEKPLYKNARALLPKYIDKVLAMPCMHRVFKYSKTTLRDVFGGPIIDDNGRPLYNKLGKPLYDKYGRPLYDKDGRPLCDCYGRPLSEEIRGNMDDQTLSVVDCLKLLKLTEASSKWMEIKESADTTFKSTKLDDSAFVMYIPTKNKSTQYIYALTRVTKFASGRQVVEILEAPLSQSTATEMHHLPVDNKPLLVVERKRHRRMVLVKKRRAV